MVSIIDAITNLIQNPVVELNTEYVNLRNRANNMGEALEQYTKDLFAGTIEDSEYDRMVKHSQVYSYTGNQNNPPDFMIRGGDAVEVKKVESDNSYLALNSSYPKAKLFANSPMITRACRDSEDWDVKDIIYTVGVVNRADNTLKSLAMVYGEDYAASESIYDRIRVQIKNGILEIPDVEFNTDTKELGRVNRVDPLGITYLRIRGMWGIANPFNVFDYVYERDSSKNFNFMAIINKSKWDTLAGTDELVNLINATEGARIEQKLIKTPDNPSCLRDAYIIEFRK